MPQREAGLEQGIFEGERAAEQKGDQILPPPRVKIGGFIHQLSVLIDPVARKIRAQVGTWGD
jgi:hypothetical protein